MRIIRYAPVIGLSAALGLLLCLNTATHAATGDHQLSVGVVNTVQVFKNMKENGKFQAEYRSKQSELAQQQHQREQEILDLQKNREQNYLPGSQQYLDQTDAIDQKQVALEEWAKLSRIQLDRWTKQRLKDLYDHISQAAAQVAQKEQLDLVIADQSAEIGRDLERATVEQLDQILASRAVLYSNKKADITQDVLAQVDANFASSNKQGPPPGGPIGLPAPGLK